MRDHSQPGLPADYYPNHKVDKKKGSLKHEEFVLQKSCITLFNNQYPQLWRCLYMIKNDGEKKRVQSQKTGAWFSPSAQRDKMAGLVPGVSDLELMLANRFYTGWYIEWKTDTGTQSPEQKIFQAIAEAAGKKYTVFRSLHIFQSELTEYMLYVKPERIAEIGRLEQRWHELEGEKIEKRMK